MSRQAEKYGYEQSKTHEIAFWGLPITPPVVAADARNLLIFNNLRKNLQDNLVKKYKKGSRSVGLVMPFLSLMALKPLMVEKHNPLESTVHISHIAQHAVAGERHAFSLEEDRSQKTEDRILARRNSGNSGNPRHFERSGAESRNPFTQKHCEER